MVKMFRSVSVVTTLVLGACASAGCTGEVVTGPDVGEDTQATATSPEIVEGGDGRVVAAVTTRAGSRVRFIAGAGNDLGMAILSKAGVVDPILAVAKRARATGGPIAFYETLTDEPAPSALRDAVRSASNLVPGDGSDDEGEEEIAPLDLTPGPSPEMVPSDFCEIVPEALYGKSPFIRCWPNQRGTTKLLLKVDAMACRVDAVEGPVSFHYKEKVGTKWTIPYSVIAEPGMVLEFSDYHQWIRRWRECHVFKNEGGKLHHLRAGGFTYLKPLDFQTFEVHFP